MTLSVIFNDFPLLKDFISLGRLVPGIRSLDQDYFDPEPPIEEKYIQRTPIDNFEAIISNERANQFRLKLTTLWGTSVSKSTCEQLRVDGSTATTYILTQPAKVWEVMCAQEDTRAWVNKMLKYGLKVYMVVGLRTVTNARITHNQNIRRGTGTLAAVQSETIAPGMQIRTGLSTSVHVGADRGSRFSYDAAAERVFGVCLRRIRFKWFSRTDSGTVLPGGNVWQVPFKNRSTIVSHPLLDCVEASLDGEDDGSELLRESSGDHFRFLTYELADDEDDDGDNDDDDDDDDDDDGGDDGDDGK
ncbi:hypothetical protein BDZ91DRAFT_729932 [Kalaharituber pfeilii]|nr:hypothetical protein BDZ91DRAFT_729932 [Kalaharituber pfeilii]